MHYYTHHIGDFDSSTRYLSRLQRSIYRDLIDLYFLTEGPLSLDLDAVARKILIKNRKEKIEMEFVLQEFFFKTDHGWAHIQLESELNKYKGYKDKQRENGSKGGRPKGSASSSPENPNETSGFTENNQWVNLGYENENPNETQKNPPNTHFQYPLPIPTSNTHSPLPPKGECEQNEDSPQQGKIYGFDEFWSAYPKDRRKEKAKCQAYWRANNLYLSIDSILDGLGKYTKSQEWTKENGRFVPYPIRFLKYKRWEDEIAEPAGNIAPLVYSPSDPRHPNHSEYDPAYDTTAKADLRRAARGEGDPRDYLIWAIEKYYPGKMAELGYTIATEPDNPKCRFYERGPNFKPLVTP